jgi:hypothetical protein
MSATALRELLKCGAGTRCAVRREDGQQALTVLSFERQPRITPHQVVIRTSTRSIGSTRCVGIPTVIVR